MGSFATGIIPDCRHGQRVDGSVLKLYGDINGDGKMVYVEYTCDLASGNLYRKVMTFTTPDDQAGGDGGMTFCSAISSQTLSTRPPPCPPPPVSRISGER